MKMRTAFFPILIVTALLVLSGCMDAYEQKGLCSYMGACKAKDDCGFNGTCGQYEMLKSPDPLLGGDYQLLP